MNRWVHAFHRPLQIGVVAVAVLVFVFLDQPSGLTALVVTALLLVALAIIELLDRPPDVGRAR